MDLGKTPRENELLTTFVSRLIRTYRHYFTTAQKALNDPFSNCLISISVKGINISIIDMKGTSINGIPCDEVQEWNHNVYLILFDRRSY